MSGVEGCEPCGPKLACNGDGWPLLLVREAGRTLFDNGRSSKKPVFGLADCGGFVPSEGDRPEWFDGGGEIPGAKL